MRFTNAFLAAVAGFVLPATSAPTTNADYTLCQLPTSNVLEGCPHDTIVVGKNNRAAHFETIQSAIASLPNNTTPYTLLVLAGNYTEQLNVTRQGPLRLLGQTCDPLDQTKNLVTVYWSSANGADSGLTDNAYTSILTVAPTLNASLTGSGPTGFAVPADTPFGCTDFSVYNIDFRNIFSEASAGPALAVSLSRSNSAFYHCGIYSYQDTVYVGKLGNAYFYGGEIAGQTDFLYGFGTAWIEQTRLVLRSCGGGLIAWKGTNTTFNNKYGCYVARSAILPSNDTVATAKLGKCSLGRPWNAQHRSVYIDTTMDAIVLPQGYTKWTTDPATDHYNNYTFMAEYGSSGPGWNYTARIEGNVTKVLDKAEVFPYRSAAAVFMRPDGSQPDYDWVDKRFYVE